MKLSGFDYSLPAELIAQEPVAHRDESRLLVLNRKKKSINETIFKDIVKLVGKNDLLVLNDTRVFPAKLVAKKATGSRIEVLLLKETEPGVWETLVKPGRKALVGQKLLFADGKFNAEVLGKTSAGGRIMRFDPPEARDLINQYGEMPLPHYIKKELKEPSQYQTVYARKEGAVAAPTAGLHFTKTLIAKLKSQGTEIVRITLHCGLGTFRPVKTQDIRKHNMESEYYEIGQRAALAINKAKSCGRRVIAVGTTVARTLETVGAKNQQGIYQVRARRGYTSLYMYPGYKFKIIDSFLTNFHLPRSTNLILLSTFAGRKFIRQAYQYAIKARFRFYSFGDAMLVE